MNRLSNLTVSDIIGAVTVVYDTPARRQMNDRLWYGLSLAKSGRIVYTHNGKRYISDPNHVLLLPMHGTYALECTEPGSFTLLNFLCTEKFDVSEFISVEIKNPQQFLQEHATLENLDLFHHPERLPEFLSVFYRMLSHLLQNRDPQENPIMRNIYTYIEENFTNPALCNQAIAEAVGISEVYLRKLFGMHTGTSPRQHIQDLRLHKAKQLLTSGSGSVSQIAEKCGYSGVYHFCRVFRQKTGYTPTEYRNQFKICL